MVELTDEQLDDWKEALAKGGIIYTSDDDYKEAVNNLVGYFDLLIQIERQQEMDATNQESS